MMSNLMQYQGISTANKPLPHLALSLIFTNEAFVGNKITKHVRGRAVRCFSSPTKRINKIIKFTNRNNFPCFFDYFFILKDCCCLKQLLQ